jgi:hypothetical protein
MPAAVVDLHRVVELAVPAATVEVVLDLLQLHQILEQVVQQILVAVVEQVDMVLVE